MAELSHGTESDATTSPRPSAAADRNQEFQQQQQTDSTISSVQQHAETNRCNNQHTMITRAKAGIFKPKVYSADVLTEPAELASYQHALRSPSWKAAMLQEINALEKTILGVCVFCLPTKLLSVASGCLS